MSERIRTLEAAVKTDNDAVKKFFDELGDREPTGEEVKSIKDLNKKIEENEVKLAEILEVEGFKTKAGERETRLQSGTKSFQFPGNTPKTGDEGVVQYASIGHQFTEDPAFKSWVPTLLGRDGKISDNVQIRSPQMQTGSFLGARGVNSQALAQQMSEMKTLVTGLSSTSAGTFVITDARPIVDQGVWARPLAIRDMITVLPTTSDTIDYVRFGTPTNAAATVAEATATSGASGTKPESAMVFSRVSETIKTLAHWIPITRQALADAPQIRAIIDSFLRYGLDEELEDQIVNGNGVGEDFIGINNTPNTQSQAFTTDLLTTYRKARTKVRLGGRAVPTAYGMHPTDWETVDLLQDNEARYFFGGPSVVGNPRLWGLPVIESEAFTAGTAYVADWKFAVLWDRMATQILVSDSHSDFFIRNMLVILAELRAGFGIIRPQAFVEIALS